MSSRVYSPLASTSSGPGPLTYEAPDTIRRMLFTTWALLDSFAPDQRGRAIFPMNDLRRVDWDFIPKPDRAGVPLFDMNRHQRAIAHSLLKAGLSMRGYSRVLAVMATENMLRELEALERGLGVIAGDFRNPEGYWFSFFGRPGFEDTWGWRMIGHHVSVSYSIVGQRYLTATPMALGAQPLPAGVLNPLGETEDSAFGILRGLSAEQRTAAVIHDTAPADFATRQVARIGDEEWPDYVDLGIPHYSITDEDRRALRYVKAAPSGVNGAALTPTQLGLARDLLLTFVETGPDELAVQYRSHVVEENPEYLHFAWAGGEEEDQPHYYRISTSGLLVESDNAVASGQHMHTVWRDVNNDLGHDLLLAHYERFGHHGEHLHRRLDSTSE